MPHLFYVIGASGVGKDALMNYARTKLNGALPLIFAHRYITRPPKEGNENHIWVSPEEFSLRQKQNLLAFHWESHGLYYGVGVEIYTWMQNGFDVVLNGSREYLPIARKLFPGLVTILIEASPEVVRQRLENRGRESKDAIENRLGRRPDINYPTENFLRIRNEGLLEEAGDTLIYSIRNYMGHS